MKSAMSDKPYHPPHHGHWPEGVPHAVAPPDRSLWGYLERSVERAPDKTAIVFYDSATSYRELARQAETLAGHLQQRCGVKRGDRVLLMSQNCPQFIVATYAVLRADAAVVPVNAMWTADEVAQVIEDSGAEVAVVAQELVDRIGPCLADKRLRHAVVITYADALTTPTELPVPDWVNAPRALLAGPHLVPWRHAMEDAPAPAPHRSGPADLCVLPYTSGTTGRPKGCVHSHASVQSSNLASVAWRGQDERSVFLAVAPLFHALGMQNGMHLPLMVGATIVMLPRWDRDIALALIERYRVTVWGAPPAMLVDFFSNPKVEQFDLSSLQLVFGGSAAMPDAVASMMKERYGIDYQEGYGMTETASFLHCNPRRRAKRGSLGVPGPGVDSRIVDPVTLEELPPGEVGEIVTRGPQVMEGYWNNPQANREAFIQLDGRRYFRTGDLASIDEDGYFFMKDRLKRMINVSGYKVWPAEVEGALYAHPAIHEACVIAAHDARKGEMVKALVVLKPEHRGRVSADELVAWGREHMAVYKAPRTVEFVDHLPKSNTGKIQWRELQERENGASSRG